MDGFCLPVRDTSLSSPPSTDMPPAPPPRQLNVRLPPDLIKQVEADKRSNQDVVKAALQAWFADDDSTVIADDSSENGGGNYPLPVGKVLVPMLRGVEPAED